MYKRQALRGEGSLAQVMSEAHTARAAEPVLSLVEPLTNGHAHAVVVTGEDRRIHGIITQTDLLAVLTRLASAKAFDANPAAAA